MENINNELSYTNKSSLITILILSGFISFIALIFSVFNRILDIHQGSSIKLAGGKINIDDGKIIAGFSDYIQLGDMLIQILAPLVIVSIFIVIQKWKIGDFFGWYNFNTLKNWLFTFCSIGVLLLIGTFIQADQNDGISFMNRIIEDNSLFNLILIAGILVPVSEEIMFRKILYDLGNMFIKKYAPYVGIVLSFTLFIIFHSQYSGSAMIYIAVLSFVLSYGRYFTGGNRYSDTYSLH